MFDLGEKMVRNGFYFLRDRAEWKETMFDDLQWYYCESKIYALRCKHGTENEHIILVVADSADEAIAHGVFELHKQ